MPSFLVIIIALIALGIAIAINYFVAGWFFEAVEAKGYHENKYFWICFCFGIIGYLLVIALPNRYQEVKNEEYDTEEEE